MRPYWPKLASLAQKTCSLDSYSSLVKSLLPKDNPYIEHIVNLLLKCNPFIFYK